MKKQEIQLNVKEDNGQYLINQTTTLLQMSNSDVTFTSTDPHHLLQIVTPSSPAVAFNITLNQLPTLTRNQKVKMTGILTLGQKEPKEVKKRNGKNGKNGKMKEDTTGSAIIHIWDELIDQVQTKFRTIKATLSKTSVSKTIRETPCWVQ